VPVEVRTKHSPTKNPGYYRYTKLALREYEYSIFCMINVVLSAYKLGYNDEVMLMSACFISETTDRYRRNLVLRELKIKLILGMKFSVT
jgi:hypothetical protein